MMIVRSLVAAAFGLAASCVLAEVEIVDRPINGGPSNEEARKPALAAPVYGPQPAQYPQAVTTSTVSTSTVSTTDVSSSSESTYPSAAQTYRPAGPPAPIQNSGGSTAGGASALSGGNSSAELFYQMQVMQQELQELRGLVEEQAFQIKKLKQQRLDDYVDLDRRISGLGSTPASTLGSNSSVVSSDPQASSVVTASTPVNDEKSHYQRAIDPIIGTNKDLDLAISRLHTHMEQFPQGRYKGNVQYWLGESYLVKDNLAESKKWFEALLNEFPLHNKVPPAKYKLGVVYHKLGLNAQAKVLLQEVSNANGPAASRAADYLKANF